VTSWTVLIRPVASTDTDHIDPRLRGRTYAFPYIQVWEAALAVADSANGWTVDRADPSRGRIGAAVRSRILSSVSDVEVLLTLDPNGQTRVDLVSASRVGRPDFGSNARRIARFLQTLDRHLDRPEVRQPLRPARSGNRASDPTTPRCQND
jgi:hypothetical protein